MPFIKDFTKIITGYTQKNGAVSKVNKIYFSPSTTSQNMENELRWTDRGREKSNILFLLHAQPY